MRLAVLLTLVSILAPPSNMLPYTGPLVRIERPLWQVGQICRALGVEEYDRTIYGCQTWGEGGCLEVIARTPERVQVIRHEDAHCNGWRHS